MQIKDRPVAILMDRDSKIMGNSNNNMLHNKLQHELQVLKDLEFNKKNKQNLIHKERRQYKMNKLLLIENKLHKEIEKQLQKEELQKKLRHKKL